MPFPGRVPSAAIVASACPVFQSNSTTSGLPMPAKALLTLVMPAQASSEPSAKRPCCARRRWSARKVGSYLCRIPASNWRIGWLVARSQTLTMPFKSADTSSLPPG